MECQVAFEIVIDMLMTAPILGFTDPKLPHILHTDASTVWLGAALYQEQQGQNQFSLMQAMACYSVNPGTQHTNWNSLPLKGL